MSFTAAPPIKGASVRVFDGQQIAALSDQRVQVGAYNAVHVEVLLSGSGASGTLTVQGSDSRGGLYQTLPDPNATQAITANTSFDVVVGAEWVALNLSGVSGTFVGRQGLTAIVTPFVSPGQTNLTITNTANQNLAQVAGSPIGTGNPVPVRAVDAASGEILGALADAAVTSNAAGSLSAKLRGLVAILADVWSDASNALRAIVSGEGIHVAASVDVNDALAADVDAAVAAAAGLRLVGWAARESAGAAAVATFRIVHGATVAGGTTVVPVELAANGFASAWYGPEGIAVPNGLSIDVIAGTVDVELFTKVVA